MLDALLGRTRDRADVTRAEVRASVVERQGEQEKRLLRVVSEYQQADKARRGRR